MSISSCPRCAKQVTLPVGVSDQAQVKCPLCHAQYTLADALANSPPLLVVIEEQATAATATWLDPAPQQQVAGPLDGSEHVPDFPVEFQNESDAYRDPATPDGAGDASIVIDPAAAPDSKPLEIEHDDFVTQEQDTEVEDFSFTSEPLTPEATIDFEPINVSGSDEENVFDLGQPAASSAPPAPDAAAHVAPADEDIELDFGEPLPVASAGDEEAMLDFGEPEHPGDKATVEFEYRDASKTPGAEEELVPDFGEPFVEQAAPAEVESKDKASKKKKDKKKKPAEPKSAAGPARKKSLVATLSNVVLPGVVAVPIALYGLLWLGPDYDFFNIGRKLPAAIVPAAFNKPSQADQLAKATAFVTDLAKNVAAGQVPLPPGLPALPASRPAAPGAEAEPLPQPDEAAVSEPNAPPAEPATAADKPPAEGAAASDAAEPELPANDADQQGDAPTEPAPASKGSQGKDAAEMPDELPAAADSSEDLDSLLGNGKPDASSDTKSDDKPAEEAEALGPIDAPTFTASDLAKAIQNVGMANEQMTAAQAAKDEAALKKARKDFYLNLFALGHVATFAKGDAAEAQLEHVTGQLAADSKRFDALKTNAARWFVFSKRTTPGIVLAGTVQEVEEIGKLYHVKVQVGEAADAPAVTVVCRKDPQLDRGDQVITLGSIVAHPEQELAGYDGSDTAVVWSGMTVKTPADGK
jgi:hypothetical protein